MPDVLVITTVIFGPARRFCVPLCSDLTRVFSPLFYSLPGYVLVPGTKCEYECDTVHPASVTRVRVFVLHESSSCRALLEELGERISESAFIHEGTSLRYLGFSVFGKGFGWWCGGGQKEQYEVPGTRTSIIAGEREKKAKKEESSYFVL